MKIYLTVLDLYFILAYLNVTTHQMDLGTVLFVNSDLENKCWSPSNMKLLSTRMIVEDLLPNPTILTMINDDIVSVLYEYVDLVYHTINKELQGNRRHIMLLAFSDALGGYMRHAVLPNVKFSFYAGALDYTSVEKMRNLYQETKNRLKTNGDGWADAMCDTCCKCEPHSFSVVSPEDGRACEFLTLYRSPTTENYAINGVSPNVAVPLPYFDKAIKPTVLAVPLKSYPLRSVRAPWGLNLVVRYYLTGYKCLLKKKNAKNLNEFQNGVYTWTMDEVMPLLSDDEIYPVFGGVLRVLATLQRLGAKRIDLEALRMRHSHMTDSFMHRPQMWTFSKSKKIVFSVVIFLLIWFVIGFCFICCKLRGKQVKYCTSEANISDQPCRCEGIVQGQVRSITNNLKNTFSKIKNHSGTIGRKSRSRTRDRATNTDSDSVDRSRRGFMSYFRDRSRSRSPGRNNCMCFAMKQEIKKFDGNEGESFLEHIDLQRNKKNDIRSNSTKRGMCPTSYLFGYDFQTSTSETGSDSDSALEMHTQSQKPRTK
ncbi:hypothetical protein WA026_016807 [Henosepilachna vigintioctopunctata]|uniref:Uncharacterized protein n=1 Tax=Henosepilachna vigintioctopunctata TaxID=420089 RepID=A0AAW1V2L6_9CUCU